MAFDRSAFMKRQHRLAKERRSLAKELGIDTKKYSDFLKKDNPIDRRVKVYQVSYQLNYRGQDTNINLTPETFMVYAIEEGMTESAIYNKTKDMVLDMKGQQTGESLPMNTRKALQNDITVEIQPRGLERVNRPVPASIYDKLAEHKFYVEGLDGQQSLEIDQKRQQGKKKSAKVNLDVTHFM